VDRADVAASASVAGVGSPAGVSVASAVAPLSLFVDGVSVASVGEPASVSAAGFSAAVGSDRYIDFDVDVHVGSGHYQGIYCLSFSL
jgi:hypothetical protein